MAQTCIKFTIVVRGDTEEDRDEALAEALKRIKSGALEGTDRNEFGAFSFNSTEVVEEGQWPA
jgi:hypothetical protein